MTCADESRLALSILRNMGATSAEIAPEPDQEPEAAQLGQWDLFVTWLGLCSVVGYMGPRWPSWPCNMKVLSEQRCRCPEELRAIDYGVTCCQS